MARARRARRPRVRKELAQLPELVWKVVHRHVSKDAYRILRIRAKWQSWLPERVAQNTWPAKLQGSKLVVYVSDNQWLHELHYLRDTLLRRITSEQGEDAHEINRIEFYLGKIPDDRGTLLDPHAHSSTPTPERPELHTPPLAELPPTETVDALNQVRDPELRQVLAATRLLMGKRPANT